MSKPHTSKESENPSKNVVVIDVTSNAISIADDQGYTSQKDTQTNLRANETNKELKALEPDSELDMSHIKDYKICIFWLNFFGKLVGISNNLHWTWNIAATGTLIMLIVGQSSVLYSFYAYRNNYKKALEVLSLCGIVFPETYKFYVAVRNIRPVVSLNWFVEKVLTQHARGRIGDILRKRMRTLVFFFKLLIVISLLELFLFFLYPLYSIIIRHELVPLMSIAFPYVNPEIVSGFIIAHVFYLFFGAYSYFGSVGFDLLVLFQIYNYHVLIDVVEEKLKSYAEINSNRQNTSAYQRHKMFTNVLTAFQDVDRYVRRVNDLYSSMIGFKVGCICFGIVFGLFAVVANQFYGGIGITIFLFTQLYLNCSLGTVVSVGNDKLIKIVYDTPWYEFPVQHQRSILILLQNVQNSMEIWIGPLAPLNVETAMNITQNIYTYCAMMLSFLE